MLGRAGRGDGVPHRQEVSSFEGGSYAPDVVLLIMNDRGVDALLNSKVKLGADASAAAGPKAATWAHIDGFIFVPAACVGCLGRHGVAPPCCSCEKTPCRSRMAAARDPSLHPHALRQRIAALRGAADVRKDGPADSRRRARRLEHVHGVLSGRAVRRLPVRPPERPLARRATAGGRAPGGDGGGARCAARGGVVALDAAGRRESVALAPGPDVDLRGAAIFRHRRQRAAASAMVRLHQPPRTLAIRTFSMPRATSAASSRCSRIRSSRSRGCDCAPKAWPGPMDTACSSCSWPRARSRSGARRVRWTRQRRRGPPSTSTRPHPRRMSGAGASGGWRWRPSRPA